jgi:hypothetical protein
VYTKDITFLLRVLGSSKQSGVLLIEDPGPDASPWLGQLQLDQGRVVSCVVSDQASGRVVLRNEEALQWLTARGRLKWQLQEEAILPPTPPPRLLPPGKDTRREDAYSTEPPPLPPAKNLLRAVPQRALTGNIAPANALVSREHRQVYALVDGQRTIEEIAQLLHRPSEFIIAILQDLQSQGFIV